MSATATAPRVLAVLVSHDGAAWLPRCLDALTSQSYPELELLAVDNASADRSRELLIERLGTERVLVADRDLGFPAAVALALDAVPADRVDHVLLVHDDLALHDDAVAHLVAALEADPRLAAVGTKLQAWGGTRVLQSVGLTVDLAGRATTGVEPGELDQGQRDTDDRTLYVSTAGMLVRRAVLDEVGGLDRRFHAFRDDLDLCWRLWLAGYEVEVVTDAVGEHHGAAFLEDRSGQTRFHGSRFFAERNTLVALLKNWGPARLLVAVPLFFLVGAAKLLGFVLTRRFSDVVQTLRAWVWNLVHLPATLRGRRRTQALRRRSDRELAPLFGRIGPRALAYVEAVAEWFIGDDERPQPPPAADDTPRRPLTRLRERLTRRPVLVSGSVLLALVALGMWPLLLPGELRGGELLPWPAAPTAFLADHLAGWHSAGAFGTDAVPSPAQALLALQHALLGGSGYLASRALLVGPLVVAWALALRATQAYSRQRVPRVAAATAYVLSPPVLLGLREGRIGLLIVAAVLPGLVSALTSVTRRASTPEQAWRAVAGAVLLAAVAAAFEPLLLLGLVVAVVVIIAAALLLSTDGAWQRGVLIRLLVVAAGPIALLAPWSLGVLEPGGALRAPEVRGVGGELWRWVLLHPELAGLAGPVVGVGFVLAGVLAALVAFGRSPGLVAGLWSTALLGAGLGWWWDRTGAAPWSGLALLVAAAAYAGLLAVAFAAGPSQLARHAFGWRQVMALITGVGVAFSLAGVAVGLLRAPWDGYALDEPVLPGFIVTAAEQAPDDPFRVLVLARDDDGVVGFEVVPGAGPTMASFGVPVDPEMTALVSSAVADLLSGRDVQAADRLGRLNVRYLVVPPGRSSPELEELLQVQLGLDPRPVAAGRLYQVAGWLPRAALLPGPAVTWLDERGELPDAAVVTRLRATGPGSFRGPAADGSVLLLSERADDGWRADAGGEVLEVGSDGGLVRVDDVGDVGLVRVVHDGGPARTVVLTAQLLLLVVSLALRPPRFARADPVARSGVGGEEAA